MGEDRRLTGACLKDSSSPERQVPFRKENGLAQGIRIVVVTGYDEVSIDEGKVAAVLQKPVSASRLLQSLRPPALE